MLNFSEKKLIKKFFYCSLKHFMFVFSFCLIYERGFIIENQYEVKVVLRNCLPYLTTERNRFCSVYCYKQKAQHSIERGSRPYTMSYYEIQRSEIAETIPKCMPKEQVRFTLLLDISSRDSHRSTAVPHVSSLSD